MSLWMLNLLKLCIVCLHVDFIFLGNICICPLVVVVDSGRYFFD